MFKAAFTLWLLLVVAMGAEGLAALSSLTGLEIVSGQYDFASDHTMIYGQGKNLETGLSWNVEVKWKLGKPEWIKLSEQGAEL